TTITEDTKRAGRKRPALLFDGVNDAIDEIEYLSRDAGVHGPEREQLRHVIVPEALPISRHDAVLDGELAEQSRGGPEVAWLVPLRSCHQHRHVSPSDVSKHYHLRPACLVVAEISELALRRI